MAGVGKTALVMHWAHQAAPRLGDGQLYVNLRGFDPAASPATPEEAIRELLDGLAVPAAQIPSGLPAQAALYRTLLAGRHLLIVLDNARDEQQVRPLLPADPRCLVLITSRRPLAGLAATDGARLLTLDLLPPAEAREMLTACLGADRAAGDPAAVAQITDLCAHLPLALAIAAARAAACPSSRCLPSPPSCATSPGASTPSILATPRPVSALLFSWSTHLLAPAAARLSACSGCARSRRTVCAAPSLAGVGPAVARRELGELNRAALIAEHSAGPARAARSAPCLRGRAGQRPDGEQSRRATVRRVLDHYLHAAHAAERLINPARDQITLAAGVTGCNQNGSPITSRPSHGSGRA